MATISAKSDGHHESDVFSSNDDLNNCCTINNLDCNKNNSTVLHG